MKSATLELPEELLAPPKRAAELLGGISERTLWAQTTPRGTIPCLKVGGRVMYSVESLKAWIAAQEAANQSA